MISNYKVEGMTCRHCAMSITEEVSEIEGVDNVVVSHEEGSMSVDAAQSVPFATISAAVAEAGDYTVTPA